MQCFKIQAVPTQGNKGAHSWGWRCWRERVWKMEILQNSILLTPAKYRLVARPSPLPQNIHTALSTEPVLQKSQDAQPIAVSLIKIQIPGDFSGGPVVKNLPSDAGDARAPSLVRELRSHMLSGNWTAHGLQLLSLCPLERMLRNRRRPHMQKAGVPH